LTASRRRKRPPFVLRACRDGRPACQSMRTGFGGSEC
jgi:hypothetical protein